jgi:hypothetical protein
MSRFHSTNITPSPHERPLEWNEVEEKRTKAFLESYQFHQTSTIKDDDLNSTRHDIFQVVQDNGEWWWFDSREVWTWQECEMVTVRERIAVLQREVLRVWCDEEGWRRWLSLSPGRREALLIYALIDVEDTQEANLRGRRQLCPELIVRNLSVDPAAFVSLLTQFTYNPQGKITMPSHPLIESFLGLPRGLSWAYANVGQAMYVQSVLVSRSWYMTMFLVASVLRLVERPLCAPITPSCSPQIQYLNPNALHSPSPKCEPKCISAGSATEYPNLETLSHRFSRCTGCMNSLVQTRVWCKRCPDVQYCSLECQTVDWEEHGRTCGKKRRRSS